MTMTESNHPGPDPAAELTALATWIDEQLGDETASRQHIAERASARIKEIATAAADTRAQARRVLDEAIAAAIDAGADAADAFRAEAGEPVPVDEFEAEFVDAVEPPETPPAVPLETAQQARELPAVLAVYEAFDADPGPGKMAPHNRRMLLDACSVAGVELGAYDLQIVGWMASWEPATCAVIAGLISRAAGL